MQQQETPLWRVVLDAVPLTLAVIGLSVALLCREELVTNTANDPPSTAVADSVARAEDDAVGRADEDEIDGELTLNSFAPALTPVVAGSSAELLAVFAEHGYAWPPEAVPPLALQALPKDLDVLQTAERKQLFFSALLPLVLAENDRLLALRERLQNRFAEGEIAPDSAAASEVQMIAERYKVSGDLNDPEFRAALLQRVDAVPVGLVLAQAANESGWGRSRFALEANNLFGLWTYQRDQGLPPLERDAGATHFVRVFPSLLAGVRGYIYNLNVGHAYDELRTLRAQLRAEQQPLDSVVLAGGLISYSERGEAYVAEIRQMIRGNGLDQLNAALATAER